MSTPLSTDAVRRITRLVRGADLDLYMAGADWYADAHSFALELAGDHGLVVEQAAGIIAALSPQVSWSQNVVMARELCTTGFTRGLGMSVSRAMRILDGEHPDDVLGGLKTRSFYANIVSGGTDRGVTVDRHAICAVRGERNGAPAVTPAQYIAATRVFQRAADILGLTPPVCQAIAWVAWRDQHGIA